MDKGVLFFIVAFMVIGVFICLFEREKISAKEIVILSTLAALAALGRVPFAMIPSAQPTTFLIIISGMVFGSRAGFCVGATAAVVSNIFLGQGPWTIIQMLAWGLCGMSAGMFGRACPAATRPLLMAFGFGWGFLFGWITNVWFWLAFVYPHTVASWLSANLASCWFDLTHAVSNVVFLFLFGKDFIHILQRFKQKLSYTYTAHRSFVA